MNFAPPTTLFSLKCIEPVTYAGKVPVTHSTGDLPKWDEFIDAWAEVAKDERPIQTVVPTTSSVF